MSYPVTQGKMEYTKLPHGIIPRLIIHGGAGNITPANLPPSRYALYHSSLLKILAQAHHFLTSPSSFPLASSPSASSLDAATLAVTLLEENPLFNSGHGAVFTRDGINELEASIMVSKGKKKRGVGVMGLTRVKSPIKLAREMLLRGEQDLEGGSGPYHSGAQGHSQLHKFSAEKLAEEWGLEMVEPSYFFTQQRWDEHIKGLQGEKNSGVATWHAEDFFPQGTCGAVALDAEGVICAATSTGGLTNKLTGRIGDTPTLGAGFWAEEWEENIAPQTETLLSRPGPALVLSETLKGLMADCFPNPALYTPILKDEIDWASLSKDDKVFRSAGLSGTGNGDSFLRTNAVRTISAIARYKPVPLQKALKEVAGPGGFLEESAGDRFGRTGEGEGGVIGIELTVVVDAAREKKGAVSHVVDDFNCGGMFRAMVDKRGKAVMRVWRPGQYADLEKYEGEGKPYDLSLWLDEEVST
ncbi:L-asparaginase precursor [Drepanopeziza brunnea f. sp. 'multigermtubi' MB_m1]|uniref:L-asparaginase n=1 Tax=Marssonina brunnea f. sp. multigermtubi (strain MB_m1) TaxID=1072389 RepID=K1Y1C9_MARBU|nr:L-asparaginase precursor [Drepanopeziza brunnea f. sp. 'multigermtubi' MB_m1]EKD18944.1 L-asparaginase precursor [Drepanopeziza brunnea f. sp. 'multigermtubi' MB_m1]